jgi:protein-tyrosine-phosphatase
MFKLFSRFLAWLGRLLWPVKPVSRKKILFVCTGNTCRSPMAKALAWSVLGDEWEVDSAGTGATPGQLAAINAIVVVKDYGDIDSADALNHHRSKHISSVDLKSFDKIVAIGRMNYDGLACHVPASKLIEWDIADPYGRSIKTYRTTATQILRKLHELKADLEG